VFVRFSPDNKFLIFSDGIWDIATRAQIMALPTASNSIWGFTSRSDAVFRLERDATPPQNFTHLVMLRPIGNAPQKFDLKTEGSIMSAAFAPEDRWIAVAEFGRGVALYDGNTLKAVRPLAAESPAYSMSFSQDGKWLALADVHAVHVIDTQTFEDRKAFEDPSSKELIATVQWGPNGLLLAQGRIGRPRIFRASDLRVAAVLPEPVYGNLSFSPDGSAVITEATAFNGTPSFHESPIDIDTVLARVRALSNGYTLQADRCEELFGAGGCPPLK
jgi:hypothetical protein